MEYPYHHLFEWGNTSLFVSVSQYHKRPVCDEEGNIVVRDLMDLIISWDDRIADGLYGQNSAELMKYFMEHPEAVACQTEEIWIRKGRRVNPRKKHLWPSDLSSAEKQ